MQLNINAKFQQTISHYKVLNNTYRYVSKSLIERQAIKPKSWFSSLENNKTFFYNQNQNSTKTFML
jgi:hypothetical protein